MTDAERMVYAVAYVEALNDNLHDTKGGQAGWHHAVRAAHAVRKANDAVEALRHAEKNARHYTHKYRFNFLPADHDQQALIKPDNTDAQNGDIARRRLHLRDEYPVRDVDDNMLGTLRAFLGNDD